MCVIVCAIEVVCASMEVFLCGVLCVCVVFVYLCL